MSPHPPTTTLPAGYLLRRMRPSEPTATARPHRRLLRNGPLPRLGPRFLRRCHRTLLDAPAATGLPVVHHGEVVALVVDVDGPSAAAAMYERLGWQRHEVRRHRDGRWVAEHRLQLRP